MSMLEALDSGRDAEQGWSLTNEKRAALNRHYKSGDLEPWMLFILLVNRYRYREFYRVTRTDPFDVDAHLNWGTVNMAFNTALRRSGVKALVNERVRMVGQSSAVAGDEEKTEELRDEARDALPPLIRELLRLAKYSPNPKGSVLLWPAKAAITIEYERLRKIAMEETESWLQGKVELVAPEPEPQPQPRPEPQPRPRPEPFEDERSSAPCPMRDRPPGGVATEPCRREDDDFADLARGLLGASSDDQYSALVSLQEMSGCDRVARFAISTHGQGLGIKTDQKLWQRLCEELNDWHNPPVLRTTVVRPTRRVYVNGGQPRFMLAIRMSEGEGPVTSVRMVEPEYETVPVDPSDRSTLFDWYALYIQMCDKV